MNAGYSSHRYVVSALGAVLVMLGAFLFDGCWSDDCADPCRDGYSCYYGVCLNRGFCPSTDSHAEQHCLETDEDNTCVVWSPYAVCEEGYSCECTQLDADGECANRRCIHISEIDD